MWKLTLRKQTPTRGAMHERQKDWNTVMITMAKW